ncbi:DUF3278 domain-containing protein [Levilactobacillus enshiensis]|uniref:DUF3278 domain-containing protein n=1 Tax=Levilactobacillus enshiensis TaxID=2590213 RepID=UPI00117AE2E8|nr:DUF3278 domain-containing protein [Levilactobacillus enshiensis]
MQNGETLRNRIVKHFFNISGDFDEYKQQEVNRIGTNAMMMCLPAFLIAPIIACFWATTSPDYALAGLVIFNAVYFGAVICPYIAVASRRAHLTDHEVDVRDMPAAYKHILRAALGYALYFMTVMYLMQVFLNTAFDGASFIPQLLNIGNIKTAIFDGIFFGVIMGVTDLVRLKKQQ